MDIDKNLKKAFRIIRRNFSCPGNDSISIQNIKSNYSYHHDFIKKSLLSGNYNFELKPKATIIKDYMNNDREVFVYNIYERWIQEYIRVKIENLIDSQLSDYVYGYRRGKRDTQAYQYILSHEPKFIIRTDISKFFNSINRRKLLEMLQEIEIDQITLKFIEKCLVHYEKGLPQGNVLSCMLSNFYLHKFDKEFQTGYSRFSDDMIFVIEKIGDKELLLEKISRLLSDLNLSINEKKTIVIESPTLEKL